MTTRRFFSDNSFWNQPLGENVKVHEKNDYYSKILRVCRPQGGTHINLHQWTVPVIPVDSKTPKHTVKKYINIHPGDGRKFYAYSKPIIKTFDTHPMGHGRGFGVDVPIPNHAQPDPEIDAHMALVDYEDGVAWDMWAVHKDTEGQWWSCTGMKYDLYGTGAFEPSDFDIVNGESVHLHGPSRASGVPAIAGLIMHDEILKGSIQHKLLWACHGCAHLAHHYPAMWTDGGLPNGIPQGSILQLDPEIDLDVLNLSKGARVVAKCLQEYGAILVDNADGITLGGEGLWWDSSRNWEGLLGEEDLGAIPLDKFRVLQSDFPLVERGMAIGPNGSITRSYFRHIGLTPDTMLGLRDDISEFDEVLI